MDQSEQSQSAEAASESQPPGDSWFEGEDSNDAPKRKTSTRAWIAGGVGAAVLAVGGIVGIHAASSSAQTTNAANGPTGMGQGQGPGGMGQGGRGGARMGGGTVGKITRIDGSTLTLTAMQGGPQSSSSSSSTASTVTVKTSDSTKVTTSSTGSLSDIKVGDHIQAMGTGSTTKITALRLVDGGATAVTSGGFGSGTPPGGAGQGGASNMGAASGTVTSIDGSTIVVTTTSGSTVTVTTSSSTAVEIQSSSSVSKLAVGDTVMVTGTTSGSTVTATAIREGALGFGGGGQGGPPGGPSGQSGSSAQGGPGN